MFVAFSYPHTIEKTCLPTQVLIPHPKKLTEGTISRRVTKTTGTGKYLEPQHVLHVVILIIGSRIVLTKTRKMLTLQEDRKNLKITKHHMLEQKKHS